MELTKGFRSWWRSVTTWAQPSTTLDILQKCQRQQCSTQQLRGQQGNPKEFVFLLNWESPHFFHHLLVQCHWPAAQNSSPETSDNLLANYWMTIQRTFIPVWTADPQHSMQDSLGLLPRSVPRVRVALRTPVRLSMLQDTEENDLCPESHSAP